MPKGKVVEHCHENSTPRSCQCQYWLAVRGEYEMEGCKRLARVGLVKFAVPGMIRRRGNDSGMEMAG